jgi:adenylate kinase
MTARKVIAVFGISGVGKTTIIRQWLDGRDDALHLQASALIRQGLTDLALDSEILRRSSTHRILANQKVLVEMFGHAVAASRAELVVFDGHLIIDTDDRLVEIPLAVVAALQPHILVHVEQLPEVIAARRRADTGRVRPRRDTSTLQCHQARSRALCQAYGSKLGILVAHVNGEEQSALNAAVALGIRATGGSS